jgi:pantothenate kinase
MCSILLIILFIELLDLIKQLKSPIIENQNYFAPSFDHSVGDPIENDIQISPK